jgi:hypothetical protein
MTGISPLVIDHGGETLELDPLGVVHLPAHRCLVVADLHLEKGSAFARLGTFLPPYDTARTLRRLDWAIQRYRPRLVVSLGDAFHDTAGPAAWTRTPAARSPPSRGGGAGSGCAATTTRKRGPASTARRWMPPISAGCT